MSAELTLKTILELGGEIAVDGDDLLVDLPPEKWTTQIRDELSVNKARLLKILMSDHAHLPARVTRDKWPTKLFDGSASSLIRERFKPDGPGWAVVESRTLEGECVVWVRDESVRLPESVKDLVCYTWAELEFLLDITPNELRHIHATKRLFGATVSGRDSLRSSH